MIQQMMMLMRIEMQLRQQALFNFQQSQDSDSEQAPRVDDALALNSQLSEISSVLATLIRLTSLGQRSGRRRPTLRELAGPQRLRRADGYGFARSAALRRLSNMSARQWREIDTIANDDSSTTDDDESSDGEVLDMNNSTRVNDTIDAFIWRQLNDGNTAGITANTIRPVPESISATSSIPDIQSTSIVQSVPSIQSVLSIQSVPAIQSVSSISNFTIRSAPESISAMSSIPDIQSPSIVQSVPSIQSVLSIQPVPAIQSVSSISNVSSVSPSIPYESRQIMPRLLVCMDDCQHATAEGQCSFQLCNACDSVAAADVDEGDDFVLRACREVHPNRLVAGDGTLEPRPREVYIWNQSSDGECGAAACEPCLSESVNAYQTYSMAGLEPISANRPTLRPVVPTSRGLTVLRSSLPEVDHEYSRQPAMDSSPLSLLPGTRRPPRLNYAARLRRQASEMRRLPSEVTIQPWPLMETGHATIGNHLISPNGFASHRADPSSRSTALRLPTRLPSCQSSVVAATSQHSNTYRGHPTRPSRYNSSSGGNHTRMSRP